MGQTNEFAASLLIDRQAAGTKVCSHEQFDDTMQTMKRTFLCRNCGHCCLNLVDAYNGCVSDADLQRWRDLGRDNLQAWVKTLDLGPDNKLHTAWVDPETGDDVERCPWLLDRLDRKGHLCGIEDVKPDHCRSYPEHQNHAAATGCKGYTSKQ